MNNFNSNWVLGNNLKIVFTINGPIVTQVNLPNNLNYYSKFATSSPSNFSGNLLGFSNGNEVYNSDGTLAGHLNGSTESRALIAFPGLDCSDKIYYITIHKFPEWGPIQVHDQSNLAYPFDNESEETGPTRNLRAHLYSPQSSLIEIPVIGNQNPPNEFRYTEKLAAVIFNNNIYVVIALRKRVDITDIHNTSQQEAYDTQESIFQFFRLDPIGQKLVFHSQIQSEIPLHGLGVMKISPNKRYIAATNWFFETTEIFKLDYNEVNDQFSLIHDKTIKFFPENRHTYNHYGVEFSPNSDYLYICATNEIDIHTPNESKIYGIELVGSNQRYLGNHQSIYDQSTPNPLNSKVGIGDLQLAPDNKIYFSLAGENYLGCIEEPNNFNLPNINFNSLQLPQICAPSLPQNVVRFEW